MPVYRLQFRGCPSRIEEDFRDLAHAKSEAMRRAADIAELDKDGEDAHWAVRIYEGEVLVHEVAHQDLPSGEALHPEHVGDAENDLDEGIADSFPASDPPAAVATTVATKGK